MPGESGEGERCTLQIICRKTYSFERQFISGSSSSTIFLIFAAAALLPAIQLLPRGRLASFLKLTHLISIINGYD